MGTWFNCTQTIEWVSNDPTPSFGSSGWAVDSAVTDPGQLDVPAGTRLLRVLAWVGGYTDMTHGEADSPGSWFQWPGTGQPAPWRIIVPTAAPRAADGSDLSRVPVLTGALLPQGTVSDVIDDLGVLHAIQYWAEPGGVSSAKGERVTTGISGGFGQEHAFLQMGWGGNGSEFFNGPVSAFIRVLWDYDAFLVQGDGQPEWAPQTIS